MTVEAPARLRMFAGPNGSGKTTLVRTLAKEFNASGAFHVRQYVNADDLQAALAGPGVDFSHFGLAVDPADVKRSMEQGGRRDPSDLRHCPMHWIGSRLLAPDCDPYTAAGVADFLRERLLEAHRSFAFETVMSHRSKVDFVRQASADGYRTYLYFVTTRNPKLNVSRVRRRIRLGGHDVPDEKVVARYHRTLALLPEVVRVAYRAFLFDNSGRAPRWLAERTPEGRLILKVAEKSLPRWFRTHVLAGSTVADE